MTHSLKISKLDKKGNIINTYDNCVKAAADNGVSSNGIKKLCKVLLAGKYPQTLAGQYYCYENSVIFWKQQILEIEKNK
jgi:hypothetical protein